MKTFLEEVAEKVYKGYPRLEDVTVVFPNRRATLFFRKHLSGFLTKPAFAPKVVTIEEFIAGFSASQVPERLVLISVLFNAYKKVMHASGNSDGDKLAYLEHFYFWGDMLLRDFEEVDKYMVPAAQLFKDLSHQKELDASFDFLTEEQQQFLMDFWGHFEVNQSANKLRFLHIWRRLIEVYDQFKSDLNDKGFAYEGMLQRHVAEQFLSGQVPDMKKPEQVVFAGFNALTTAEEKVISFFVDRYQAKVYWDVDAYYVHNVRQEAGRFFRQYQEDPVLAKTFSQDIPAHFQEKILAGKEVQLYGAAQPVG
ncbi:MAG: PD-(D/E)XK nuclease family protein, partial [Chryseosolibacter sp.]